MTCDHCDRSVFAKGLCARHYNEERTASMPPCIVDGCDAPVRVLQWGLCSKHDSRKRATGRVDLLTPAERLWKRIKVRTESGCWLLRDDGQMRYGVAKDERGVVTTAHRIAYESVHGPIPEGLVIDHMCNTPPCVNPSHLQAITQRENVLRAETSHASRNARKTHCKHGHPLSGENLYERNGRRHCRTCRRDNQQVRAA